MHPFRPLLPLLLLTCAASTAHAAIPPLGDLDGDGAVTVHDAALALQYASGLSPTTFDQLDAGDVASIAGNVQDGRLDMLDAFRILQAANGQGDIGSAGSIPPYLDAKNFTLNITHDVVDQTLYLRATPPDPYLYNVRGTLTNPPGVAVGEIQFTHYVSGGYSGFATGSDAQGRYHLMVAAATYSLGYGGTVTEPAPGGSYTWTYLVPLNQSVTVSGPTHVDVAGVPPPATGIGSGTVTARDLIPNSITGQSLSGGSIAFISGPINSASYSLKGVPGSYALTVSGVYGPNPAVTFQSRLSAGLKISADQTVAYNVSLPSVAPLSLQIAPLDGTSLYRIDLIQNASTHYLASLATPTGPAPYQLAAPPGQCSLTVDLRADTSAYVSHFIYATTIAVPDAGGVISLSLPPLPAKSVIYSGTVLYPNGTPAANVPIYLSGGAGSTRPLYAYAANVQTDADGRFSVPLPPDTYFIGVGTNL